MKIFEFGAITFDWYRGKQYFVPYTCGRHCTMSLIRFYCIDTQNGSLAKFLYFSIAINIFVQVWPF